MTLDVSAFTGIPVTVFLNFCRIFHEVFVLKSALIRLVISIGVGDSQLYRSVDSQLCLARSFENAR